MPDIGQLLSRSLFLLSGGYGQRLSILIYHRVLPERDWMRPGEPTAAEFDGQMRLLSHHFNVLPLVDAVRLLREGRLPARTACVTFDDGYRDNATIAMPILQRYSVPATLFVASGYVDGGRMWNDTIIESFRMFPGGQIDLGEVGLPEFELGDIHARRVAAYDIIGKSKYLPQSRRQEIADGIAARVGALPTDMMLAGQELLELHRAGIEIGGHTVTHPILNELSLQAAKEEIGQGKTHLEEIIGQPLRCFAYPNGRRDVDYTDAHAALVAEAGFELAVSTNWGAARQNTHSYHLPRFTPWDKTSARYLLRLAMNLRA